MHTIDRVRLVKLWLAVLLTTAASLPGAAFGFSAVVFPAPTYSADTAAMDLVLGITGLTIEDFEDVGLAAGLQVATTNPSSGPTATLPRVYLDGSGVFNNNSWAGPGALVSTVDNRVWFPGDLSNIAARTTFLVPSVGRFGVGLGNFQGDLVDHAVFVNGALLVPVLETLPGFVSGINLRNGYLVITAGPGESIESVAIEARVNGGVGTVCCASSDGLIFDHVAFGSAMAELKLNQSAVAGCKSVTGTVTLPAPAPVAGTTVSISDTLTAATTPLTVTVPAGATSKPFSVKTVPVAVAESGTVRATVGGTTLSQNLTVRPMGLSSVSLTPTSAVGGTQVTGKATLECNAGPGPILVDLTSSNAAAASPVAASIAVPQGLRSATFNVSTNAVQSKSYATISGVANGITKSKKLTVNVAAAVSPTRLGFGSVPVNTTSGVLNATLTNKGATAISISSIGLTGTNAKYYAQTSNCPTNLAAGASCTIGVTFKPTLAGSKSATLSIAMSATSTPLKVTLSGTGL